MFVTFFVTLIICLSDFEVDQGADEDVVQKKKLRTAHVQPQVYILFKIECSLCIIYVTSKTVFNKLKLSMFMLTKACVY